MADTTIPENDGTVEALSIDDLLREAKTKLAEITSIATTCIAAKTQIVDDQAVIATKSDHIQNAQEHADTVRASLDRTLTAATQQASETEGYKARAQSAADAATQLLAEVRVSKGQAEGDASGVSDSRTIAEDSAKLVKALADKSENVATDLRVYEENLGEVLKRCRAQMNVIDGLLPGATSAGLAYAFDQRRQTFLKPHNGWQYTFVGSVLALAVLAVSGLAHVYGGETIPTYDELGRLWLARLPVAGALVWLALYASRESALAKRLEEDYGYKSAISSCFEGFRKQMSEVGKDEDLASPLTKLCQDTLTTIANPPGRIYEKHALTISPTGELANAAKSVVGAGKLTD